MHHRSSIKYLLLSALALAVIVGDAYFGRRIPNAGTASDAIIEATPATPLLSSPPSNSPQVASIAVPAIERTEAASVPSPSPTHDDLSANLKVIEADYQAMAKPILAQSAPIIGAEERTKLAYLDQEKLADLGKVLSTDELEVYKNTPDPAATPRRR